MWGWSIRGMGPVLGLGLGLALSVGGPGVAEAAEPADPPVAATAAEDPGLRAPGYKGYAPQMMSLRHGELVVRPHVRLELRAAALTGDDNQILRGDLAERPGFGMPRARLGLNGQLAEHVPYAVVTDLASAAAGGSGALTDAWIGYERFHFFKMWFGVRTVPFSYSAILSSADSGLSERARSADAMAPFRQVGVTLGGDYDLAGLSWRIGVYNGFDRKVNFFRGAENGAGLRGNRFHGLSAVGRLQAQPLGKVGPEVADLDGGGLRLSLGGGGYVNDSGAAWMTGASADLHLKVGGAHLLVEWIRDTADPVQQPTTGQTLPEALVRQAMSVEAGYTYGKLGLAVRAEMIDPNTAVETNDDEMWLSGAITWHFIRNMLRAQLQFDHRQESAGQPYDNDTLLAKIALRY